MVVDNEKIKQYLKSAEFLRLFIEELGWDRYQHDLDITIDQRRYHLQSVAQKAGMPVLVHTSDQGTSIPDYTTRNKIERDITKNHFEHIIIYTDSQKTTQIWQWVKREQGKTALCRQHNFHSAQSGEALAQKIQQIGFSIEEEEQGIPLIEVTGRVRSAFDLERVTKRFYDRFKTEHDFFYRFINGIPTDDLHRWYASIMLNRLMFIYFIQKKNFLNGDVNYLRTQLNASKQRGKDLYFKELLCPLFFEGFAKPARQRNATINKLLGKIPYLNGGLFLRHQIEEHHGATIKIPDTAFEKIFDFFDAYEWHLDERPLKADNEINPDVLGYIFEKYINQKQMGAYYTKEDITEYISKNTVLPFLFEKAKRSYPQAFDGEKAIWKLLQEDPDRYIYDSVKYGVSIPLPPEISGGIQDISQRENWNKTASDEYGLPTETWREIVARRTRYEDVKTKLARGGIRDINDFITYNLNIQQFARDVLEQYDDPERLCAFWQAIKEISVLDPTCGSGAFLFAAVNILEPLYEACLDRMEEFVESPQGTDPVFAQRIPEFNRVLERVGKHPNRKYFVFKSIIINNLFGVDIMEEAVEICKLRLFLKLIAQIDRVEDIEPLPDIDFNIRVGNTLVGYTTYDEVKRALRSTLDIDNAMARIDAKAKKIDNCFTTFRRKQTDDEFGPTISDKTKLNTALKDLETELNQYLATEYEINPKNQSNYSKWLSTHKPFHWFIEFYTILKQGGFDIILGNPPYVEYNSVKSYYTVKDEKLATGGNLHSMVTYRCLSMTHGNSFLSMIVPVALPSTDRMMDIRNSLFNNGTIWISNYAIRPSKLFSGVEQRLSIYILSKKDKNCLFSTKYQKWYAEERNILFESLHYQKWSGTCYFRKVWPKLDLTLSESIIKKVIDTDSAIRDYLGESTKNILYYKNTGIGYFVLVTKEAPQCWINGEKTSSSRETHLKLKSNDCLSAIHCILNSSLFYVIYQQFSNCRDLNPSDILLFRLPESSISDQVFKQLSDELQKNLILNSWFQIRNQKQTGEVKIQSFTPALSKPIIDRIDNALAEFYGFTEEELDYIINYDIKYRMGGDDEGDD